MKEKLILVGAGGLGRVVLEIASKWYNCVFLDDNAVSNVDGTPIVGKINDLEKLYGQYKQLVVTIGNNILREQIYQQSEKLGYTFPNVIAASAYISPYAKLGNGIIILNNAVVQNGASIGSGTILNSGVEAHHDSTIGNNCLVYTNSVVRSLAKVGDRALIGSTVTISTRAIVQCGTVIGDGSVVR